MQKTFVFFLSLSFLLSPSISQAQISFRGKPVPECIMFFITEAGGVVGVAGSPGEFGVNYEFGLMYNLNQRSALGATLFTLFDGSNFRGIKLRYRHWMNSSISLDVSPGLSLWGYGKHPQFTGHVGLNFGDWIALIGQADIQRQWHANRLRSKVNFSMGVKFGSYAGCGLMIVSGVGALIIGFLIAKSLD